MVIIFSLCQISMGDDDRQSNYSQTEFCFIFTKLLSNLGWYILVMPGLFLETVGCWFCICCFSLMFYSSLNVFSCYLGFFELAQLAPLPGSCLCYSFCQQFLSAHRDSCILGCSFDLRSKLLQIQS